MSRNIITIFFLSFLVLLFQDCGYDSEKNVLTRRYNNFLNALPDNIKNAFIEKRYDDSKKLLKERMDKIEKYTKRLDANIRKNFIRANYKEIIDKIKFIPEEDLDFNKKMFKVIDYECIPTFTAEQIIDYFRENFMKRLEEISKK